MKMIPQMSEQIRSAELLVRSLLSNPEALEQMKVDPAKTLKFEADSVIASLPRRDLGALPEPSMIANNAIWMIVTLTYAGVMAYAAYILGSGVSTPLAENSEYITKSETILTVFTTVSAFIGGLLIPSPLKR